MYTYSKLNLIAVQNLLETLGKDHPKYRDVVNYQSQLLDNLEYVTKYGDNENYRSTRNRIIDQINCLAIEKTGKTLNEFSKPAPIQIEPNLPNNQEAIWPEFQEPEMSFILPGPFIMGSHPLDSDAFENEFPLHVVSLEGFNIATTAVTNLQYALFILDTGYDRPEYWQNILLSERKQNLPVVNISWFDAVKFCNWLRNLTNKPYRLPTEAEWEKAARGVHGQLFPWGNQWKEKHANTKEYNTNSTVAVNEFPEAKSPYDVLNMAGNVYEWTSSLWGYNSSKTEFSYPYIPGDTREAPDAPSHILRIIRGGAYNDSKAYARCAYRDKRLPENSYEYLGFRLALSMCEGDY